MTFAILLGFLVLGLLAMSVMLLGGRGHHREVVGSARAAAPELQASATAVRERVQRAQERAPVIRPPLEA